MANDERIICVVCVKTHQTVSICPPALILSVSPVLKVLGTTRLLLPWVTAHVPEVAGSASRWGLAVSGFLLNPLIHHVLLPSCSHFLVTYPQARCDTSQQSSHTPRYPNTEIWQDLNHHERPKMEDHPHWPRDPNTKASYRHATTSGC